LSDDRLIVALVAVVSGPRYIAYAERMFSSAQKFFLPGASFERDLVLLPARSGWPAATMYRYHVILENEERLKGVDYVFMIDADMRFTAAVGAEILAPLVGTTHPGYVGTRGTYETRPESAAYVSDDEGTTYFCGGFVGGARLEFMSLAEEIRKGVDVDDAAGITAVWHDESHLNRYFASHPPSTVLSPSYCYPEDDQRYLERAWTERYDPKIVALAKPRRFAWLRRLSRAV